MGCHTWIYKKLSKVSNDKIKELCDSIIKSIDNYWIMKENPDIYAQEMHKFSKNNGIIKTISEILEDRKLTIAKYNSYKDLLQSYSRKHYIKYLIKNKEYAKYLKNNGEYYILINCDSFRFRHYTNRRFKSSDKLIKYFTKKNFEGCSINDKNGKSEELLQTIHDILDSGDCIIEFG